MIKCALILVVLLTAVQAHAGAAESGDEVLPMATRAPGTPQTFAPRNIPLGAQCFGIRVDRTQWLDTASIVEFRVQASFDGGATWADPVTGEPWHQVREISRGGVIVRRGVTRTHSKILMDLPQADNPNRQLRGGYRVSGASATFSLEVRLRNEPCGT